MRLVLLLFLAACSNPAAFNAGTSTDSIAAPGTYAIYPKVDFVIALDDTGSMTEALNQIRDQFPIFLTTLGNHNWDFHAVTVPLTATLPVTQVIGSIHDPSMPNWVPDYPGQTTSSGDFITPSFFQTPSSYSAFAVSSSATIKYSENGLEPGLSNILSNLTDTSMQTSGALRSDALLVVLAVSTGNDTSNQTISLRVDGVAVTSDTATSTVAYFQSQFQALKRNLQFYALVPAAPSSNCIGTNANTVGARYQQLASLLSGASYDICNQNMSSIFSSLANTLQITLHNYTLGVLTLNQQPQPATITIKRSNGQIIPQDPINGWTYSGYLTNTPSIIAPVKMNNVTGYAITLHGTGQVSGTDSIAVTYIPVGSATVVTR